MLFNRTYSHTRTSGNAAWWLLTLARVVIIHEVKVHNREILAQRLDGAAVWVGAGLTGGNYDGAVKVGTIQYVQGTNPFVFSNLEVRGSSVQIQGGSGYLQLAEVEVYVLGKRRPKSVISSEQPRGFRNRVATASKVENNRAKI